MPVFCCNGFCGPNSTINNPQYFQFIATATDVQIQIHVDICSAGQGLQSAIVNSCDWQPCPGGIVPCPDILDCNPGTSPGGTMVLNASELVIGQTYWLLIDGTSGSTCQYTINFVSGVFEPQIDEEITKGEAIPGIVCQGFDDFTMTAGPPIQNAHGYIWLLEWNASTVTSTEPINTIDIANNAPVGLWDICVLAFSGCDTSDVPFCFVVEIVAVEDVVKDPVTFCVEEFPFFWHEILIAGPGSYKKTFNNSGGCPYDSIWIVDAYPAVISGFIDTISCQIPFVYDGITYDDPGTHLLEFPGMSIHGCDSTATLHVEFEYVQLFIQQSCIEGQSLLQPYLINAGQSVDTILYAWYTCGFDTLLSNQKDLVINAPGCYCLIYDGGFCSDTICSYYYFNPCSDSCSVISESICVDDSVLFYYDGTSTPGASYHWLIDIPGSTDVFYSESDSVAMIYDTSGCYHVSLTIVGDTSSFTCMDSFCIEPVATTASICCSHVLCDDCVDLTFNFIGTAPWSIILSSSAGPDTISGIVTSPYLHTVCISQQKDTFTLISVTGFEDLCMGTVSGENFVIIAQNENLNPVINIVDSVLCTNSFMLYYHWHECDSAFILETRQCYVPAASGCYCVDMLSQDSCTYQVCTDFVTGINETGSEISISVFPNPTTGRMELRFPASISIPVEWKLYDIRGIEQENGIITGYISSIQLKKLNPGVYFMRMRFSDEQVRILKLIIQ
ncbi:MAG: T9SS type A sorting domain-containing protein [Chitinophagales bacterium]|nr:T9SS type A sorting domain-containing protein [Chitinophagales bacterium]